MSEIKFVFNEWRNKLQLEECPIKLRILDDREKVSPDYKALIIWKHNENTWEVQIPKIIDKSFIIHELGHIFFPKKINDMRLAPGIKNREDRKKLNYELSFCLNQLVDCFVDHYLSEFNEYYQSWVNRMLSSLQITIPKEWGLYKIVAFYLLHYIEFKYLFRDKERIEYNSKINQLLTHAENVIISRQNGQKVKFDKLKKLLDGFNLIKNNKDSNKVIYFIFEIIKILGLWEEHVVSIFFKIRYEIDLP